MAKIFSTEQLSLNGDSIRIKSSAAGAFEITDANSNVLMSRDGIETNFSSLHSSSSLEAGVVDGEISSLQAKGVSDLSGAVGTKDTEISSLQAKEVSDLSGAVATKDTEISSLQAKEVSDIATLTSASSLEAGVVDGEISSLQAKEVSDISSLSELIGDNDVVAVSADLTANDTSKTVSFGRTFSASPKVVATMVGGASDPIIGVQLSAVSTSEATFQFSDDIPNNNYKLEVLASL